MDIPNRILKESICISDTVDKLDWFSEVFFYRLIVNVDDYGRMDARPAILRARLFPLKSISDRKIADTLQTLSEAGCVELYEVGGSPYLCLPSWDRHQTIRAKRSKFPAPPSASNCKQMHADACRCSRNPIQSESESESVSESEPPTGLGAMERAFERFWRAYPRQQRKYDAWQAWQTLAPDEALTDRIIAAVKATAHSRQWQRECGKFIPNPDNYLTGRRWEDKLPAPRGMIASNLDTATMDELVRTFVPRQGGV